MSVPIIPEKLTRDMHEHPSHAIVVIRKDGSLLVEPFYDDNGEPDVDKDVFAKHTAAASKDKFNTHSGNVLCRFRHPDLNKTTSPYETPSSPNTNATRDIIKAINHYKQDIPVGQREKAGAWNNEDTLWRGNNRDEQRGRQKKDAEKDPGSGYKAMKNLDAAARKSRGDALRGILLPKIRALDKYLIVSNDDGHVDLTRVTTTSHTAMMEMCKLAREYDEGQETSSTNSLARATPLISPTSPAPVQEENKPNKKSDHGASGPSKF